MQESFIARSERLDRRESEATAWAAEKLGSSRIVLRPVSGDASFRRYFRLDDGTRSVVLMDAPPDREDSSPFIDIATRLRAAGLNAPQVFHFDLERGFGLLEDFGDTLYRELITPDTSARIFPQLFELLGDMAHHVDTAGLPEYDAVAFSSELSLFSDWYLDRHRNRPLSGDETGIWNNACSLLIESAMEQPRVFVHRDFHSCNLLSTPAGPGIIDFQDGVHGPVSYDFISLVWDRYIAWDRAQLEAWMKDVYSLLPVNCDFQLWVRYCDWMGIQRNLKIVGIFARLKYRDNKAGYLEMIPVFYQYLLDVLPRYPEFRDFQRLLELPECAP